MEPGGECNFMVRKTLLTSCRCFPLPRPLSRSGSCELLCSTGVDGAISAARLACPGGCA